VELGAQRWEMIEMDNKMRRREEQAG